MKKRLSERITLEAIESGGIPSDDMNRAVAEVRAAIEAARNGTATERQVTLAAIYYRMDASRVDPPVPSPQ